MESVAVKKELNKEKRVIKKEMTNKTEKESRGRGVQGVERHEGGRREASVLGV